MRLPYEHLIAQRMKAPLMRSVNGIGVLNLIAEHGPVSRAALAKLSHLSKPTVSSQVERLIRLGLAVEVGQAEAGARGGKKPTMVKFNARAGRLFAAEIRPDCVRVAESDLEGHILRQSSHSVGDDRTPATVLGLLCRELRDFHPDTGPRRLRLLSVAAPGRVDVPSGTVLEAGNLFHWRNVAVRVELEKAFGIPVIVDNDVNMATLGELHHGVARGEKDIVLVRLETGIGSGIVVRGKLLHGNRWAAGEIAHLIFDLSRAGEDWNARGYLESVVAADRIAEEAAAVGAKVSSVADFLRAARSGNGAERGLLDTVVLHLGLAIATMVCAYDPAMVVLQGALLEPIMDDIRAVVGRAIPWESRIEFSNIGRDAALLGAIVAARTQAYERIARSFDERAPKRKTRVRETHERE